MNERDELLLELRELTSAIKQMAQAQMVIAELIAEQMGLDEQEDTVPAVNGMGLAAGKIYRKADDPLR